MNIWDILGIVAIVCLVLSFGMGKNSVWGGMTLAIIVGLISGLFVGFEWGLFKKILTIGVLFGAVVELLFRMRTMRNRGR